MTEPAHFAFFADRAAHLAVTIDENVRLARDTFRMRFRCPTIARRIVPGQFLMFRLAGTNDPLLGRPLALYDTVPGAEKEPESLDIVYLAVGKMTRRLSGLEPGSALEVWGPLGNGFPAEPCEHLVMVAGGIGQTPFMALARESLGLRAYGDPPRRPGHTRRVTLCYGARSAEYLAGIEDFRQLGVELCVSTDDGSAGHHGLVTELVRPLVERAGSGCRVVCCGPEAMMEAVAALVKPLGLPCHVSLESPMACGLGICFSCVVRMRDGSGGWDYRRSCVEGPVFPADQIEF